jgi:hypothetical protein
MMLHAAEKCAAARQPLPSRHSTCAAENDAVTEAHPFVCCVHHRVRAQPVFVEMYMQSCWSV